MQMFHELCSIMKDAPVTKLVRKYFYITVTPGQITDMNIYYQHMPAWCVHLCL